MGPRASSEVRDFEHGKDYDDLAASTYEVGIEDNEGDGESPFEEVVVKEEVPWRPMRSSWSGRGKMMFPGSLRWWRSTTWRCHRLLQATWEGKMVALPPPPQHMR
jgi:hypothetical protein